MKTCCSPECSSIHRKMLYSSGTLTDIHKVREKMFELSESLDASERWGTKHWVIQSPSGKVYEIDNLFNFIKNNPELFDGTPRQAYDGFSKIKASMEGKRKNPSSGWKGWTLVSYSENKNAYIGKKKKGGGSRRTVTGFIMQIVINFTFKIVQNYFFFFLFRNLNFDLITVIPFTTSSI